MKENRNQSSQASPTTPERKGKDRGEDVLPGTWSEGSTEVQRRRGEGRSDVEADEGIDQRPTEPNDPRVSPT